MRFPSLFLLASLIIVVGRPVAAQCLELASLQALGVAATGQSTAPPAIVSQVLSSTEWRFLGPVGNTRELAWTSRSAETPLSTPTPTPTLRLSLRPVQGRYDVVLKTTDASCVRQLRQELTARRLKPQPITCPNCLGQRYLLPEGATVSFYSKMRGDYPLVVVLHPAETPAETPADANKTTATRNP